MQRITVVGAGSWGTALSVVAARAGHDVRLWSRSEEVAESINKDHLNSRYLRDEKLPESIVATTNLLGSVADSQAVILATPSHATRDLLQKMKAVAHTNKVFIGAAKGIEFDSAKRMSEVAQEVFAAPELHYVCLSGPSFAKEVVARHPTAIVAAGNDPDDCRYVQTLLSFENLRIYTNDDLIGVELGGAIKNVVAIAAGMVTGLGYGTNSVAALITRGLAEMSRLAVRQGARRETMMGLAGLGDLVLTATGALSRNRFVGEELGRGRSLQEICDSMNEVAEGVKTTAAVMSLAKRLEVETPITAEVHGVLYAGKSPQEAMLELMTRPLKDEF